MKRILNFFTLIAARINADSPVFFQSLGNFFAWIASASAILTPQVQGIIIAMTGYGLDIPVWLSKASTHIAIAGLVGKAVASLTVDHNKVSERKYGQLNQPVTGKPEHS